ncbi:MAG: Lrp/AsnC ligand binding domain-containing protein [Nitrosopumilus sp.]|nr:Lrp/AsnC ligand binding domain-containing protein [Nitrososphaerota archaeon]MCH9042319.1 Lrp/AsnC ligand binding domain-containing protein [Nitrososphaerota archaeon]
MSKAYVLIGGKLGLEKEIISKLKTIENVKEVHGTLGTFDFIAKVEADSEEQVNHTILEKIRRMGNVSSTVTLMTVEDTDFFVVDSNKIMTSILGNASAQAYVVFHTDPGKEIMVARNFNKIPEVKEVDVVLGYYDVIGKVETSSHKELEKIVTRDIRKIENIQSSMTLIVNM